MYDHITPAQWVIGLAVSLIAFCALWWLLWRRFPPLDDEQVSGLSSPSVVPSVKSTPQTDRQTTQPDQQTPRPSVPSRETRRLALDRTRAAVLEELLTHGWTITDLRREGILRGDNTAIGHEVAETRARLGLADPDRTLKVRDAAGEREILLDAK